MLKRHSVFWFVALTVLFSFGVYFLPLPAAQKSYLVPILLVFVPAIVCIPLVFLTEGRDGLRRLFSRAHSSWRWALIGAATGALMRVAVLVAGRWSGMPVQANLSLPGTVMIIIVLTLLAWFEELGWRRFALDRMLKTRSPFASAMILGLPWGIVHLVVVLPGIMNEGAPPIPQTIVLVALGVVLTWAYVRSGGSLLAVTLLHGVQNGLVDLNRGLTIAEATWLMMDVYVLFAAVLVIFDRQMFFKQPTKAASAPEPV